MADLRRELREHKAQAAADRAADKAQTAADLAQLRDQLSEAAACFWHFAEAARKAADKVNEAVVCLADHSLCHRPR